MNWLNAFKHLLPNAKAWRITTSKRLREFFEGLTGLPSDTRTFLDNIFDDIDPQKTRELEAWEKQFNLSASATLSEQERRDRLAAAWSSIGGQSPQYLQDTLRSVGFDVYVHEWWEPSTEHPAGGSVNGDVTPVLRNPTELLDDGTGGLPSLMSDGIIDAQDGDEIAMDGATLTPSGYPLVNKYANSPVPAIPADPDTWRYFLYIGGETFPEQAVVAGSRKDELEEWCLKVCPAEQWLGMLITYS